MQDLAEFVGSRNQKGEDGLNKLVEVRRTRDSQLALSAYCASGLHAFESKLLPHVTDESWIVSEIKSEILTG